MRRAVGVILLAVLLGCGSQKSESETEKQTKPLLDSIVWHDTSKPPRDKAADSATCNEKADNDPRSKQSDFARLGVWVNCMKELGWGKKEK